VFAVTQTTIDRAPHRLRVDPRRLGIGEAVAVADELPAQELVEVGQPVSGVAAAIVDSDRRPLPDGHVGEIVVRAPFLFSGYNEDAARTAQVLQDGSYYSRDLGFWHEGRLYVLGRIDDLIIVNGRNIYAHEVEAVVSGIEGVKRGRNVAVPVFDQRVGS